MSGLAEMLPVSETQFWLHGKRADQPVRYDDNTGMWDVYGYPEALEVIADPATYSSDTSRVLPDTIGNAGNIVQADPPLHTKLRKLISHAFTRKVVADLEPRIAALTGELLDTAAGRDRIELVGDLAYPMPVIVIAELLGIPASDRVIFKKWVDELLASSLKFSLLDQSKEQEEAMARSKELTGNLTDYLAWHVTERRRRPRNDLLTRLVESEVDGERLTGEEVVNFANILLLAGHITTTMLLGNTILCLNSHPDWSARIRADRTLVPGAIEESLRLLTPFAALGRVTNREVELGGRTIPADQLLMIWVGAANRDPDRFPRPHTFNPARDPPTRTSDSAGASTSASARRWRGWRGGWR